MSGKEICLYSPLHLHDKNHGQFFAFALREWFMPYAWGLIDFLDMMIIKLGHFCVNIVDWLLLIWFLLLSKSLSSCSSFYTSTYQRIAYLPYRKHDCLENCKVECSWNMMAFGDAPEGKWRGNWRMEWVTSTLHTTSEHGVSSITTADAETSVASSRLN